MPYQIRLATLADAALLAELGGSTFYDTFAKYHDEVDMRQYIEKAYAPDAIEANLKNNNILYSIAFDNQIAVGYTKLILNATHELLNDSCVELEKIYVRKNYMDKKAGAALMNHVLQWATHAGFKTMFLGVWQENERAVKFYFQNGFETFTTRTFQLGTQLCDDFLMKKAL